MRKWELDIGVEEVTIRGWPDGPFIYARARQGHPVVSGEDWQFIVDALNVAEERAEWGDAMVAKDGKQWLYNAQKQCWEEILYA